MQTLILHDHSTFVTNRKSHHVQPSRTSTMYNHHSQSSYTLILYIDHVQSLYTVIMSSARVQSSCTIVIYSHHADKPCIAMIRCHLHGTCMVNSVYRRWQIWRRRSICKLVLPVIGTGKTVIVSCYAQSTKNFSSAGKLKRHQVPCEHAASITCIHICLNKSSPY